MSWLVEDPKTILMIGGLITAALVVALIKTGRMMYLAPIAASVLVTGLMLLLEWYVVTEREAVEHTIFASQAAIESNDFARVDAMIAPEADDMRRMAELAMNQFEIKELRFTGMEVKINEYANPPTARIEFFARLSVNDHRGTNIATNQVVQFWGEMRKDGDRWLWTGYGHNAPGGYGNLRE